ncbi:MAG: 30S ribosomal protein S2 [Patescibacteria group bacterium]|nr:30S ribosomal protein S2 [Patescibacteria group bacterium]MDE1966442.1 30S ribosomal protein S2 [Patescibacteria group bacterium]
MTTTATGSQITRLFDSGAHFAQVKSRRHPSMKPFILGAKARVEIIDLAKTETQLEAAKAAMTTLAKEGKNVLFVGGKKEISDIVKNAAMRAHQPYVAGRWLGGTISNFPEIKKRIDRLADLSGKRATGELAKLYTKLEVVRLSREIERLSERLDGITELAKRPDALLVVDTRHEAHAVKEARDAGIPVIAILGSDCNLADAAYPVVANDSSRETVAFLLGELVTAFEKGKVQ